MIFPLLLLAASSVAAADVSIADFGAKPNGTLATEAISNAVSSCFAQGGGRVVVPPGRWSTGPVVLRSNVEFHLAKGAVVFIPDDSALRPTVRCAYEGRYAMRPMPGVYAVGCTNVAMTGEGTLETATGYWHANRARPRPQAVYFENCAAVRLDGIKVRGSPSWTMHFFGCTNVTVRGVDSCCPGPNTDGIDLESVEGAVVENCRLDQGDDAFCIKSGRDREGRERNRPSRHIVIRNCTVVHGHTLLGIGSELSGGIRDVTMENCRVEDKVWRFLRVKTNPARGGFVEDVRMENVTGGRATEEIFSIETDYFWKQESKRNPEIVPTRIRGIYMRNVSAESAKRVERRSVREGLPLEDIVLENVTVGPFDAWEAVRRDLLRTGGSRAFYWALTHPEKGKQTLSRVGAFPKFYYEDFHDILPVDSKAEETPFGRQMSAVIRRRWEEYGATCIFSWHMPHPCVTNGFPNADYRYMCAEHRNVIRGILADEQWEGLRPREWWLGHVRRIAAFINGLVDASGRPIPVILRYPHEMDGGWFWWSKCTKDEFIRLCRVEADALRRLCGDRRILFAYTPDRRWQELGESGERGFLGWYPGDEYVDIVGFDDYSIGKGTDVAAADWSEAETLRKMRLVSAFARERGKVACLSECGLKDAPYDFYSRLYRLMTSEGVDFAFADTWAGPWTIPSTSEGDADMERFKARPGVLTLPLKTAKPPLGNGGIDETAHWQMRIDEISARGGGCVTLPRGRHLVGQLDLKSNVELHLEKGASLEGRVGLEHYRVLTLPYSEGTWSAVISAVGVTNVAITGGGEIFGNGRSWPQPHDYGNNQEGHRARGLFFANCEGVRLEDFTLRDAASWGIVFKCSRNVLARRIRIDSHANANNDGFDIEAANVLIEDCDVDSGDDAYCIKSNDPGFSVENVIVRNSIGRSHCCAFKIGTASHGTVRNIRFERCRAEAPRRDFIDMRRHSSCYGKGWFYRKGYDDYSSGVGIAAIAVECVDGGIVEGVVFSDIELSGYMAPIFIRGGIRTERSCGTPPSEKRILRDVTLSNVHGRGEGPVASSISGVDGCRAENIRLKDVEIVCRGASVEASSAPSVCRVPSRPNVYPDPCGCFHPSILPAYGLYIEHADVSMENVVFRLVAGAEDVRRAVASGVDARMR